MLLNIVLQPMYCCGSLVTIQDSSDEDMGKVAEDVSGDNDEEEDTPELLLGSSEEEAADRSDSLKDFIVEDKTGDKNEEVSDEIAVSLPRQCESADTLYHGSIFAGKSTVLYDSFASFLLLLVITGSQLNHFQVVLKALMINVLDETFLKSLYGKCF